MALMKSPTENPNAGVIVAEEGERAHRREKAWLSLSVQHIDTSH